MDGAVPSAAAARRARFPAPGRVARRGEPDRCTGLRESASNGPGRRQEAAGGGGGMSEWGKEGGGCALCLQGQPGVKLHGKRKRVKVVKKRK